MRFGARRTLLPGLVLIAAGLALFARVPVDGDYLTDVLPSTLLLGTGVGVSFPALMTLAMSGATPSDSGLASGLVNTSVQVGGALGLAVLATLAADKTAGVLGGLGRAPVPSDNAVALVEGFQVAFFGAACLMLAGVALLGLLVRRRDVANVNPEQAMVAGA